MTMTFLQNPRTAGRVIDGVAFVVTPHDNRLHTLNATGTFVWTIAERPVTWEEVAGALRDRYDVAPEAARADAERFLDDLVGRGIFIREGGA